ncbi:MULTISPECIES: sugar-binding transcriptional regulator [unclassified Actinomyces]|uniref:sugar-binding transcriptional regulator n=1 Tax=unclassified Actinomyces TaxID=2609248 RepID=UPI000D5A0E56|nr:MULTISPECIES: sugar-binding transcriptional regulator [unclassified Actinomyces]RAX20488.1 sugar-binding transcriptional regulator [Actinomyces sp. Z3]
MCANLDREHARLLLDIAHLYWDKDLSQDEIAERLGYSRSTVSRKLTEARRVGIVQVTVAHPIERLMALEEELTSAFGLKQARVTEVSRPFVPGVTPDVARAAAELLVEHCGPRSVIAVSNGRAVAAVVHQMPERTWPTSTVVAMIGSAGESYDLGDGGDVCRNLAMRLGGRYRSLTVPLVFDSLNLARAVRQEDQVATTLELAARSDVALTGIGAVGESTSPLLRKWMTPQVVRECRRRGAVAHVCGHHLDAEGRHVPTALCERTLCMEPERLKGIPFVVGVAAGEEKVTAIRAALRGGYLSALVTDEVTARAVLEAAVG